MAPVRKKRPEKIGYFPPDAYDIVLEVLGHLHPLDLLHLSQTTREFRALLHGPALDGIWREAFVHPLPMCPNDIPGRRWAQLLFGAHTCECGEPNTLPDFAVLRRLCSSCIRRRLSYIHDLCHGHSRILRKLIPGTARSDGDRRHHIDRHRAVISEARAVIEEYEILEADEGPEPEGPAALAAFVLMREKLMRERQKVSADEALPVSWNKVRREVIPQVLAAKRWRLNDALRARRKVVDDGITDVLCAHRAPSTWAYSPVREIANFPEFTVLTSNEDEDVVLVPNDVRLVAALAQLPAKLDAWCISQQGTLASRIPVAPGSLELATTVFTCGREHTCTEHFYRPQCCLVGWRAAGAARGYSSEQMDGLDQRFVCNDCPIQHRGREVMTWRVCLQHALGHAAIKSDPVSYVSSWSLLSALAAADVRRREDQDPSYKDSIWLCNLCPAHFNKQVIRKNAIAHVSTEHHIAPPIEGVHFIYNAGARRSTRPPVFLGYKPHVPEYRCNHCAVESPHLVKLLPLRAMMAHVRAKHSVLPTEREYTQVERLIDGNQRSA
ncbi:hypothetical protein B0H13DRAFT_2653668 [Mycena leptocephala]|nr:hypothetical protein B0H13DRAFT_2653668 [Mycena leptocephala]